MVPDTEISTPNDFEDYYDLLSVDENADSKTIEDAARKLLGTYHPDVSDHPHAGDIYEEINLAERILTDSKQRKIYDALGHDEYVRKREKYGALQLSLDGHEDMDVAQVDEDGQLIKDGAASRDHRGEASEGTPEKQQDESEKVFDTSNVDLDSPRDSLLRLYRQVTFVRMSIAIIALFVSVYISQSMSQNTVFIVAVGPVESVTSVGTATLSVVGVTAAVVAGSGLFLNQSLRKSKISNAYSDMQSNDTQHVTTEETFGNITGGYASDEDRSPYATNSSQTDGFSSSTKLVTTAYLLTVVGAYLPGMHPWEYIQLILKNPSPETQLWVEYGTGGVRNIMFILNILIGVLLLIVVLISVFSVVLTLSRRFWIDYYLRQSLTGVIIWDTVLYSSAVAIYTGLMYGGNVVMKFHELSSAVATYFAIAPHASGVTVAIGGMSTLIGVITVYFILSSEQKN